MKTHHKSGWQGRASKIASLQAQLESLKLSGSSGSGSSSPKFHGPIRGNGDGSSRQGSLTPANFESSSAADKEILKGRLKRGVEKDILNNRVS